jgi:hypothetical protein
MKEKIWKYILDHTESAIIIFIIILFGIVVSIRMCMPESQIFTRYYMEDANESKD